MEWNFEYRTWRRRRKRNKNETNYLLAARRDNTFRVVRTRKGQVSERERRRHLHCRRVSPNAGPPSHREDERRRFGETSSPGTGYTGALANFSAVHSQHLVARVFPERTPRSRRLRTVFFFSQSHRVICRLFRIRSVAVQKCPHTYALKK